MTHILRRFLFYLCTDGMWYDPLLEHNESAELRLPLPTTRQITYYLALWQYIPSGRILDSIFHQRKSNLAKLCRLGLKMLLGILSWILASSVAIYNKHWCSWLADVNPTKRHSNLLCLTLITAMNDAGSSIKEEASLAVMTFGSMGNINKANA